MPARPTRRPQPVRDGVPATVTEPDREPSEIDGIATRYWEDVLRLSPTTATVYGDERYNDRLDDPGPAGRAEARRLMERVWREAAAVSPDGLSDEDRITRDILQIVAEAAIEADDLSFHEMLAVDQINGPQTLLAQLSQFQPADTPERLDAWLSRIRAYGPYIDAHIDIMADGLRSGRTAARIVADRTIEQISRMQAIPIEEAIVPAMSKVASEDDRERVRAVVAEVAYPADRRLLDALTGPYHAATREQPGLVSVPDGDTLYRHAIRRWTSLDMEPADVHQVGLDELAAINEERRAIAGAEGFGTDLVGYRRKLATDPANQAPTPEELVARCNEDIVRAAEVAPTMFGRLPVASCEVRPVEAFKERDAPFAYYFPPSLDLSRPGIYYVNTYDLPSRTFSKLASTTWQEQNRQILNALRLERIVTVVTIGLIQVVAALNILIALVMMVMEKHRDIAILMSMGARAQQIRRIFVWEGAMIGAVGTVIGMTFGRRTGVFRNMIAKFWGR